MIFFFFFSGGGVGPEIADFGPVPGSTRPRGALGKAPAEAQLDLHQFLARETDSKAISRRCRFFEPTCDFTYLRLVAHFKFLIVRPDQKVVMTRP